MRWCEGEGREEGVEIGMEEEDEEEEADGRRLNWQRKVNWANDSGSREGKDVRRVAQRLDCAGKCLLREESRSCVNAAEEKRRRDEEEEEHCVQLTLSASGASKGERRTPCHQLAVSSPLPLSIKQPRERTLRNGKAKRNEPECDRLSELPALSENKTGLGMNQRKLRWTQDANRGIVEVLSLTKREKSGTASEREKALLRFLDS